MRYLKSFAFLTAALVIVLIQVSCTQLQENLGRIVISVTFPEQTRSIPTGTDYIEVAVKEQSSDLWTTKSLEGSPGETATITFDVPAGIYDIHVMAKDKGKYGSNHDEVLALGKTEGVHVIEGESTTATVTLFPLHWTLGASPAEIYEGEKVTLVATLVAPRGFEDDLTHCFLGTIYLGGTLRDALSADYISFTPKIVTSAPATVLIRYISETFVAPQVEEDATYTWYLWKYMDLDKWLRSLMNSPQSEITVKNGGGSLVIIIN